ncbi:MAG: hypothetical protein IKN50_02275 [Clostridia bacterium]|nr:hypothetical protein [Clostridia bacterium]
MKFKELKRFYSADLRGVGIDYSFFEKHPIILLSLSPVRSSGQNTVTFDQIVYAVLG